MNNELQVLKPQLQQLDFSQDKIQLIKATVAIGATDLELQFFIEQCKRTQLDPVTRQIYFIKDKNGKVNIQTSIDGLRLIAERSDAYEGQTKAEWCGTDGIWKDIWLSSSTPSAARVGVFKRGFREALYAVALYAEYAQMKEEYVNSQKTGKKVPNYIWGEKPSLMLSKVAEALALRKAFPNDMSGIYTVDEYTPEAPSSSKVVSSITNIKVPLEKETKGMHYAEEQPPIVEPEGDDGSYTNFTQPQPSKEEAPAVYVKYIPIACKKIDNFVIDFGKHKGHTIEHIGVDTAHSYGMWMINQSNSSQKIIPNNILDFLDQVNVRKNFVLK